MADKTNSHHYQLATSDDLLLCRTCGTQYDETDRSRLISCKICTDPRQYIPPSGQTWTTLRELRDDSAGYKLVFTRDDEDENVTSFQVEPKVGIGQRGFLISTSHGTVIWDTICFLDQRALDHIARTYPPVVALIISHPHFYTIWPDWARSLACPIYLARADSEWLVRQPGRDIDLHLLNHGCTSIMPGVQALVTGGHFPGSTMLHVTAIDGGGLKRNTLFHADTIHIVPSGKNPDSISDSTPASASNTLEGGEAVTYAFMWSVPNMIPLSPAAIEGIWSVMKTAKLDYTVSHGLLDTVRVRLGPDRVRSKGKGRGRLIERVLLSMQIAVKAMGYTDHPLLREVVDW